MSVLWMDSFDHYATADMNGKYNEVLSVGAFSSVGIDATNGRRSSGAFKIENGNTTSSQKYAYKIVAPTGSICIAGFSLTYPASWIGTLGDQIFSVRQGLNPQVTLRVNQDGSLSVVRGNQGGTVLGTSAPGVLSVGVNRYIEFKVTIHSSTGTVDVRVNNTNVLSLTSQNTQQQATAAWDGVALGCRDSVANSQTSSAFISMYFDDYYVLDGNGSAPWNNLLGDSRVDPRYPTAAGATTGFTPSAGSNFQTVDEVVPNGDTDYNQAAAVATDTFIVQDVPVAGSTVFATMQNIYCKKSDAGVCSIAPVIRHSGVDNVGADFNPGTTYTYLTRINQVNPGTGVQWTEAGFNAAEFGYKRTA